MKSIEEQAAIIDPKLAFRPLLEILVRDIPEPVTYDGCLPVLKLLDTHQLNGSYGELYYRKIINKILKSSYPHFEKEISSLTLTYDLKAISPFLGLSLDEKYSEGFIKKCIYKKLTVLLLKADAIGLYNFFKFVSILKFSDVEKFVLIVTKNIMEHELSYLATQLRKQNFLIDDGEDQIKLKNAFTALLSTVMPHPLCGEFMEEVLKSDSISKEINFENLLCLMDPRTPPQRIGEGVVGRESLLFGVMRMFKNIFHSKNSKARAHIQSVSDNLLNFIGAKKFAPLFIEKIFIKSWIKQRGFDYNKFGYLYGDAEIGDSDKVADIRGMVNWVLVLYSKRPSILFPNGINPHFKMLATVARKKTKGQLAELQGLLINENKIYKENSKRQSTSSVKAKVDILSNVGLTDKEEAGLNSALEMNVVYNHTYNHRTSYNPVTLIAARNIRIVHHYLLKDSLKDNDVKLKLLINFIFEFSMPGVKNEEFFTKTDRAKSFWTEILEFIDKVTNAVDSDDLKVKSINFNEVPTSIFHTSIFHMYMVHSSLKSDPSKPLDFSLIKKIVQCQSLRRIKPFFHEKYLETLEGATPTIISKAKVQSLYEMVEYISGKDKESFYSYRKINQLIELLLQLDKLDSKKLDRARDFMNATKFVPMSCGKIVFDKLLKMVMNFTLKDEHVKFLLDNSKEIIKILTEMKLKRTEDMDSISSDFVLQFYELYEIFSKSKTVWNEYFNPMIMLASTSDLIYNRFKKNRKLKTLIKPYTTPGEKEKFWSDRFAIFKIFIERLPEEIKDKSFYSQSCLSILSHIDWAVAKHPKDSHATLAEALINLYKTNVRTREKIIKYEGEHTRLSAIAYFNRHGGGYVKVNTFSNKFNQQLTYLREGKVTPNRSAILTFCLPSGDAKKAHKSLKDFLSKIFKEQSYVDEIAALIKSSSCKNRYIKQFFTAIMKKESSRDKWHQLTVVRQRLLVKFFIQFKSSRIYRLKSLLAFAKPLINSEKLKKPGLKAEATITEEHPILRQYLVAAKSEPQKDRLSALIKNIFAIHGDKTFTTLLLSEVQLGDSFEKFSLRLTTLSDLLSHKNTPSEFKSNVLCLDFTSLRILITCCTTYMQSSQAYEAILDFVSHVQVQQQTLSKRAAEDTLESAEKRLAM